MREGKSPVRGSSLGASFCPPALGRLLLAKSRLRPSREKLGVSSLRELLSCVRGWI